MAFDPPTNQVVLFGGGAFVSLDDTWTWDGTRWTPLHPKHHPGAREHATMAYDTANRQLVLFGGDSDDGTGQPRRLSDTWTWDGTDWAQLTSPTNPPASVTPHMAYDPATQRIVLVTQACGCQPNEDPSKTQTWTWDGHQWSLQAPAHQPLGIGPGGTEGAPAQMTERPLLTGGDGPGGDLTAAATDPKSGHVVVVEKVNYAGVLPGSVATWTWTGSDWSLASVQNAPLPTPWSPVLVPVAGRLMYLDAAARLWSWDGTTWQATGDAPGSLRRGDDAAAIDAHAALVVFGGVPALPPGGLYGDTWTWANDRWIEAAGSSTAVAVAPIAVPRPAGGISAAQAMTLARKAGNGTPVRAVAGPMRKFWGPGEGGPGGDRWVWAVLIRGSFPPASCGPYTPIPHPCPSPATTGAVFLDYVTGEWLQSGFPAPPQLGS
jgi:hypothetical protein